MPAAKEKRDITMTAYNHTTPSPTRCPWCAGNEAYYAYHDTEWGTPVHDDRLHFEMLVLESMSCGLSWLLVLKKREIMRACFDNFEPAKVVAYTAARVERIMATPGMIKSQRKIEAVIHNARVFLDIASEWGSFDRYMWSFTQGKTLVYRSHRDEGLVETRNDLSDRMARDLKKRGFKYMGSVILYSHLQGIGVINDHHPSCFRYRQLLGPDTVVV